MNKIFLSGYLTRDPESKTYNGKTTVTKTTIAVKRNFSQDGDTDFFNIVAFGKTGEFLCKYFEKGRRFVVEGRLQQSNYTDKDGNSRAGYDIIVDNIESRVTTIFHMRRTQSLKTAAKLFTFIQSTISAAFIAVGKVIEVKNLFGLWKEI